MSLAWVAGSVRAGLLASRRVGRDGARTLAKRTNLSDALRDLSASPYGRELADATSLAGAQRAVAATLLWHLRVLAGWLPPPGGELLRALAAWFEIANVRNRLAYLAGEPYLPPFELGGLATAWPALAHAGSPEAIRAGLAGSRWGDPGGAGAATIGDAMLAAWTARVAAAVPEAAGWASAAAALRSARDWPVGPADLAARVAPGVRWVLAGIDAREDLWLAEARWWSRIETEAGRMAAARRHGRRTVVGVVALLAADAWRVRAALAAAALGPAGREAFDAIA